MSIDYEVLRRRPEAGQMDLLLVAAKKDEINDYAAIVREAKLRPLIVDINAFTIQNIFEHQYGLPAGRDDRAPQRRRGGLVAEHRVARASARSPARSRTPGNAITEEIRKALRVLVRAGRGLQARRRADADRAAGGHQIIDQACEALAGEIQRSLDFYLATSGEQEISRIYVSGGSAYLAPLVQAIEKRARVPVQLFDPMANLAVDAKSVNEAELRAMAAQLVVALGLSLRCDKERRQWFA